MRFSLLKRWIAKAAVIVAAQLAPAATEQELIATLQSSADVLAKSDACRQLRVLGTHDCVPALAALLNDERLNHPARYALEGIPGPAPLAALRAALEQTTGNNQAGVIDSLGRLHDAAAPALIIPRLWDPNPVIAEAAAVALGCLGGKPAVTALLAARDHPLPAMRSRVCDALLHCADASLTRGGVKAAESIYDSLDAPGSTDVVRLAAWRGKILCDTGRSSDMILSALTGTNTAFQTMALSLLRERGDAATLEAALKAWKGLPAEAQIAVLQATAILSALAAKALPLGAASSNANVRVAAWQTAAKINALDQIPALAAAAAGGPAPERNAAREALARLRGADASKALLANLTSGPDASRAEIVRALGERRDQSATTPLLAYAAEGQNPLRTPALAALQQIAAPQTLSPLLRIAVQAESEERSVPVVEAARGVAIANPEPAKTILPAFIRSSESPNRARLFSLLPDVATPAALETLVNASRATNRNLAREAVAALAEWPNPDATEPLLALARTNTDTALRSPALRGAINTSANEPDQARRLTLLREALALAPSPAEKKLALSQLGSLSTADALRTALDALDDPAIVDEAGLAALTIAGHLSPADANLTSQAIDRVLAKVKTASVTALAWALRGVNAAPGSFIRQWAVSGPYRRQGAGSALEIFDVAFPPEIGGTAAWKPLAGGDSINLLARFPGQQNCAAYLKAELVVARATEAMLLLGSDDGVKGWLNGQLVHTNNIDRGLVVDQDKVPLQLRAGTNALLLKITQGGGGWSACARVVGVDGSPVPGLRVQVPALAP
jgi:HEAT repeat protein